MSQRPPTHPGADKAAQVRQMFAAIHDRYDRMNRLMTLGRDLAWRRVALRETALPPEGLLLDVATGSGDVLTQAARLFPSARAVGVDFTPEMLEQARARLTAPGLLARFSLMHADALALPFADGAFDAVISAFMMRNVTDVGQAFREQTRVVQSGGRVVCLELTWPRHPLFRRLFALYFQGIVPRVGGWVSKRPEAYRYLPESVANFLTPERVANLMTAAGLVDVRYQTLALGTVTIHVGARPGPGGNP